MEEQQQKPDQAQSESPSLAAIMMEEVEVNGVATELTLTGDGKLRWKEGKSGRRRCLTVEKEVLGFVIEGEKVRVKAVIDNGDGIFCSVNKRSGRDSSSLMRRDFVFTVRSEESRRLWSQHLRDYLDSLARPKRLFTFVNPFGGKKSALKIFLDHVKPLLEDADVQLTVQETKYQLHAKEVARGLDLSKYDGIVCVSGDGVLIEVINGLLEREDWSSAIKMPLGLVPAGTGNGMAKSLLDAVGEPCKASNATLAIIRGHKRLLDVATIFQGNTKVFSVLMLAWGLIADIDIESERYRWMGSARIDFYALQRILNLRQYNGSISFVPAPGFEAFGEPTSFNGESTGEQNSSNPSNQLNYQGPSLNLSDFEWRTIKGPFVSIWLHNVPWGGESTMAAPDAKFSDGYLDLIVIKECPKLGLLAMMMDMNKGGHVKSPHVMYLKVKAFILEPGSRVDDVSKGGIIDVDGEVLARGNLAYKINHKTLMAYDKLQISIDQGLATVFSPRED